jgi:hypothetical protein
LKSYLEVLIVNYCPFVEKNRAGKLLHYLGNVIVNGPSTPLVTDIPPAKIKVLFLFSSKKKCVNSVLRIRIRDPMPFGSGEKNHYPDPGCITRNILLSLETIFWVKILKFFDAHPGSGMEKIRMRNKHPGSATLVKCTA